MLTPEKIKAVSDNSICLYQQQDIDAALEKMAALMCEQLADKNPVFLCVMIGALIPMAHLLLKLDFPLVLDYIHATRYNGKVQGSTLVWKKLPDCELAGRTVVVFDDILDGGLTLTAILDFCRQQGAKAVYSAVLLDKVEGRLDGGIQQADFTGLTVSNQYVYGYGMDYESYLRNLTGIYAATPKKR